MSLTSFAFRSNRLFYLLLFIITLLGIKNYLGFPSQEDPSFTIREAVVTAYYPGMSAERMENLVTRRLEEKIREIPEVENIRSSSKTDYSIIHVTVSDRYFHMQSIWDKLRNKMDEVKPELPSGTRGPFVNDEYGDVTIATLALTSDGFSLTEMYDTAVELRRELYTVPGVKQVKLYGVQDEVIYLEFLNAKLAEHGLTPQLLVKTLKQANTILPGGKIEVLGRHIVIEPSGNFTTEDEIRNLQIFVPGREQGTYLRDIVDIKREYIEPPSNLAFYRGKPAIMIGVSMSEGENILTLGKDLSKEVSRLQRDLPIGYSLDWGTFQADQVESSIADFTGNFYQTLAIVLIVVVVFLGMRTGLIVGLGVPLTMLFTLLIMRYFEIPLQRVSIAALIISLGLLVDNGIVVAEDIKTRLQEGANKIEAAIASGNSLALPLLTSSITTILAFVPLMMAEHRAGEYTYSMSQVVSLALLTSWFFAVTITPLLCAQFIELDPNEPTDAERYNTRFYRLYRRFLDWVLHHKAGFLGGMVILMIFSAQLLKFVPKEFFPPSDRAQFTVNLDMGQGASINQTAEAVAKLNLWLNNPELNPEVASTVSYVGEGGPRFFLSLSPFDPDPNRAMVLVDLKSKKEVQEQMDRTRAYILSNIPETNPDVKPLFLGPSETGTIKLRIVGTDKKTLYRLAQQVKADLQKIDGTVAIEDDWGNQTLGVFVDINAAQAGRSSIAPSDMALSLNAFYSGYPITDYREEDKIIPIMLRAEKSERDTPERISTVNVYSATTGNSVPLLQVASLIPEWDFSQVKRRNFENTITVSARNPDLFAAQLQAKLLPYLKAQPFPPGYRYEWGGEIEDSAKAQKALFANLPLCLTLAFILLVWQFNSIRRPTIVFLTMPLLIIGGAMGLFFMGATLSFVALLGFLSLGGILINNAIVLIDRIDEERADGKNVHDAVVAASLKRFRPIMMTTLTTVLGLVPLILFGGAMWYGMANVIAFGLTLGTVLTLGVVPVLYVLLFDKPKP